MKLLIPVDGSAFTSRSVAYAIRRAAQDPQRGLPRPHVIQIDHTGGEQDER